MATSFDSKSFKSIHRDLNDTISDKQAKLVEEIEQKQIVKLYSQLSFEQKKTFIVNLLNTYDEKLIRILNFSFESLRHNDLNFKLNKSIIKQPKYSNKKLLTKEKSQDSLNLSVQKRQLSLTKLPKIREKNSSSLSKSSKNTQTGSLLPAVKFLSSKEKSLTNLSLRKNASSNASLSRASKLSGRSNKKIKSKEFNTLRKQLDIDMFIKRKNKDLVNKPWDLYESVKSNDPDSTKTLISKLKGLFKQKYLTQTKNNNESNTSAEPASRESTFNLNPTDSIENLNESQTENFNILSSSSFSLSNTLKSFKLSEKKTYYLNKLKNNYYERKLWNSLELNNKSSDSFNYYADNNARFYTSEYEILKWFPSHDEGKKIEIIDQSTLHKMFPKNSSSPHPTSSRNSLRNMFNQKKDDTFVSKLQHDINETALNERNKYLISILEFIPRIKVLSDIKKQTLFLNLIKDDSDNILDFYSLILVRKLRPDKATIENLPDNILLRIFSHLDDKDLESASTVSKRWYFLSNTTELWMFKCHILGRQENLGDFDRVLLEELLSDEDIDWKLAYIELKKFINELKTSYSTVLKRSRSIDSGKTYGKQLQDASLISFVSTYSNFYQNQTETEKNQSAIMEFKTPSEMNLIEIKSQLSQLVVENNKNHEIKRNTKHKENHQQDMNSFQENKTELIQAKDLLNKLYPKFRLRWKGNHEATYSLKSNETILFDLKPVEKIKNLMDHTDRISCMDFDKNRLVTGGMDRLIFVYDIRTFKRLGKLEGHKGGIRCLELFANRLCSGSWDATLILWNMYTFEKVITVYKHMDSVSCLYFDLDYLITGSHDKTINIWKFNEKYKEANETSTESNMDIDDVLTLTQTVNCHRSPITCLEYDGINTIITCDRDGIIYLTNINGNFVGKCFNAVYKQPITCLRIVGALIIVSNEDGNILFWNRNNLNCEAILTCHDSPINSIAYHNQRLFTASDDKLIKEWDLRTLTCIRQMRAHYGPVLSVLALDNLIISSGSDRTIVWNLKNNLLK